MKNLFAQYVIYGFTAIAATTLLVRCTPSVGNTGAQDQLPTVPVLALNPVTVTTYRDFPATIEGRRNIEIRPQVDGYLEAITVDEGDYVKAGQVLFRINDRPYKEQLLNARAALLSAEASLEKAQLEIDRLRPLVVNNIVSDVQMRSAEADHARAKASVSQAEAMVSNAEINLGYTVIKAPVEGFIGRIPMKVGSLVGRGEPQPLTVLSDISEVYAYFSMSEVDFIEFQQGARGNTLREKLDNVPPVELVLPDGSSYSEKGRIETVEGQFNRTTGSISIRASFPNKTGVLRSGTSGQIRIPSTHDDVLAIPQKSTFELQDKVLVFVVNDSNKVASRPIQIEERNDEYYFVRNGVRSGDRIVFSGLARLRDGNSIDPQPIKADTLQAVSME
jgi:membrane fusion protein (multidrug efflux system)